jgi:hypothetical protein
MAFIRVHSAGFSRYPGAVLISQIEPADALEHLLADLESV